MSLNITKIKEYPDYGLTKQGRVYSKKTGKWKELIPQKDTDGYLQVRLYNDGVGRFKFVHRLVAESYLERKSDCHEVNHIDGDKTNNSISNLEWCDRSKNMLHAHDNMLLTTRTPVIATDISNGNRLSFKGQREAARCLNLNQGNINHALKRKNGTCGGYRFEYVNGGVEDE